MVSASDWLKRYGERYTADIAKFGINENPTLWQKFVDKYNSTGNMETAYASTIESEIKKQAVDKINKMLQEKGDATGAGYSAYAGTTDIDSLATAYTNTASELEYANKNKTETPEPYKFEKTSEMQQIEDLINSRTLNTPTFNPENVTKWVSTLDTAYKPYEQKALDQAQGEYRRLFGGLSGGGSASFNRVIQQSLAEQQALKQQTALGLAQSEYDKQYQDYTNSRGQALDLQKFYADQSKYTNAQETQNAWNQIQRQWGLTDAATQRGYDEQDWQKQADLAEQLAEMTKPQQTNWYDYILPAIGTGLGYGFGGGITGATTNLFSNLFKSAPKNYAATPVTAGTPDYLKLYGLK